MAARHYKFLKVLVVILFGLLAYIRMFLLYQQLDRFAVELTDFRSPFKDNNHNRSMYLHFSWDPSSKEARLLNTARRFIESEMRGRRFIVSNKTLDSFILEKGGEPIRNVIISTWRSGSSFLGRILNSHPGTYYDFEPLLYLRIHRARSGSKAQEALRVLHERLYCNFYNSTDFNAHKWILGRNTRVRKICQDNLDLCWDPYFLSSLCSVFPIQTTKIVRLRLGLVRSLLQDSRLNLRVLYLVRDPRGTMQSRYDCKVCGKHSDCINPAILCSDLVDDYNKALNLRQEFPDRFLVIRYEDMALQIHAAVKKIFNFLQLEYGSHVNEYLDRHTKINRGDSFGTNRDTRTAPFHWMQDLSKNWSIIENIQSSCGKALDVWDYKVVHSASQLQDFSPMRHSPWSEF